MRNQLLTYFQVVGGPVPISTRYSLSAIVDASGSSTVSQQTVGTETIYSSDASATPVSTISNESLTSTLFGTGSAGSQTTLQTAVSTSEVLTTVTNESTTQVSTVGSTTISSAVTTSATAAASTSSEAAGARQTAGVAFMAVAGLAALII